MLDLDDTLLESHFEDKFLPAYLSRLADYLGDVAPKETLIPALLASVGAMTENLDPTRTLKEVFDAAFYPAISTSEETLRPRVASFYEEVFPEFQAVTTPIDNAPALVRRAIEGGLQVVVATNPLFPLAAIEHRLRWAGLAPEDTPFDLVTSYESFHFSKPHPEYYAEILGRLGRPATEAAVMGNDPPGDLAPAALLGASTFHVLSSDNGNGAGGTLDQGQGWLDELIAQPPPDGPIVPPSGVLARLRGYLSAALALTHGVSPEAFRQRPDPSEWAPVEIVCHLRDLELEVYQPRLDLILTTEDPFISAADPDQWAAPRRYIDQSPSDALEAFVEARLDTVDRLAALDESDWLRTARHALFGPTTLIEVMCLAADHDLLHLRQLRQTLGYP